MKCGTCSLTPILALVGLVGLGVGGYNWVSTGCPLGSCSDETTKVMATSADKAEHGACGLCPSEGGDVALKTVAMETKADCSATKDCAAEAKGGDCCKGAAESCCQTGAVAQKTECSEMAKSECTESAKSECPMMKAQEEAAKVASEKPADKPAETAPIKPS